MNEGKLVPDTLVNQMVAVRLSEPDTARGFILDGFPRTLAQADWLDGWLASQPQMLPVVAVSIQVDYTHLLQRIGPQKLSGLRNDLQRLPQAIQNAGCVRSGRRSAYPAKRRHGNVLRWPYAHTYEPDCAGD